MAEDSNAFLILHGIALNYGKKINEEILGLISVALKWILIV